MAMTLVINTVLLPLLLGVLLALVSAPLGHRPVLLLALTAACVIGIYLALEGLPPLPPVSSKQRFAFVLLVAAGVAFVGGRARLSWPLITGAFLLAAAGWLGMAKFGQPGGLIGSAFLLAPVAGAVIGSRAIKTKAGDPFLWPNSLLALALGAATLAFLGQFVGFAQVSGALAAFIGGLVALRYLLVLAGRQAMLAPLPEAATAFLLMCFAVLVIQIGLFAPGINKPAVLVLALTLLVPMLTPSLERLPQPLRPLLQGLIAVLPALAAVVLAAAVS